MVGCGSGSVSVWNIRENLSTREGWDSVWVPHLAHEVFQTGGGAVTRICCTPPNSIPSAFAITHGESNTTVYVNDTGMVVQIPMIEHETLQAGVS